MIYEAAEGACVPFGVICVVGIVLFTRRRRAHRKASLLGVAGLLTLLFETCFGVAWYWIEGRFQGVWGGQLIGVVEWLQVQVRSAGLGLLVASALADRSAV